MDCEGGADAPLSASPPYGGMGNLSTAPLSLLSFLRQTEGCRTRQGQGRGSSAGVQRWASRGHRIWRQRLSGRWWGSQEARGGGGSRPLLRKGPSASLSRAFECNIKMFLIISLGRVCYPDILIILKGQQRSFESPSVLSCNQLINWKPFSSVCRAHCWG